eukprot:12262655-Karenia_brevis.AAC.1
MPMALKGNHSAAAASLRQSLVDKIEELKHQITLSKSPGERVAVLEGALVKKQEELIAAQKALQEAKTKVQDLQTSIGK